MDASEQVVLSAAVRYAYECYGIISDALRSAIEMAVASAGTEDMPLADLMKQDAVFYRNDISPKFMEALRNAQKLQEEGTTEISLYSVFDETEVGRNLYDCLVSAAVRYAIRLSNEYPREVSAYIIENREHIDIERLEAIIIPHLQKFERGKASASAEEMFELWSNDLKVWHGIEDSRQSEDEISPELEEIMQNDCDEMKASGLIS
jgi:hypothetical protein